MKLAVRLSGIPCSTMPLREPRGQGFAASLANSGAGSDPACITASTRPVALQRRRAWQCRAGPLGIPLSGIGNHWKRPRSSPIADGTTAGVPLPPAVSQGNPVVNLSLSGTVLTVTHVDASEEQITLPAGGGTGGVDQASSGFSLRCTE